MANAYPFLQNRSADLAKSFAAGLGAIDLTAVTKFPTFGPQLVEVHNANAAASQNALLTLEDNTTLTVVLAPNESRYVRVAVKAFQVSGADVSAIGYWWNGPGSSTDFQYQVNYNP